MTVARKTLGAIRLDDESRSMLYDGCSISQFALLFDMVNRDVSRKLHHCEPCGERAGYPIYKVKEAAKYLVEPSAEIISDTIKKLDPKDLPTKLSKAYWDGRRSRLNFELENGDSWPTDRVIETLSKVFKTLSMEIKLIQDQIAKRVGVTEEQREILLEITDKLLNDMATSLVNDFKNEKPRSDFDDELVEVNDDEI